MLLLSRQKQNQKITHHAKNCVFFVPDFSFLLRLTYKMGQKERVALVVALGVLSRGKKGFSLKNTQDNYDMSDVS
jgi:hypothetical protein